MSYASTLLYIALIVLINTLFAYLPMWSLWGYPVSPMDFFVGVIYIFRDFAQREIKHYIIAAMLVGCAISYFCANKHIAIASVSAFAICFSPEIASSFSMTGMPSRMGKVS